MIIVKKRASTPIRAIIVGGIYETYSDMLLAILVDHPSTSLNSLREEFGVGKLMLIFNGYSKEEVGSPFVEEGTYMRRVGILVSRLFGDLNLETYNYHIKS